MVAVQSRGFDMWEKTRFHFLYCQGTSFRVMENWGPVSVRRGSPLK